MIHPEHATIFAPLADHADAIEQSWSISGAQIERRVLFFFDAGHAAIDAVSTAASRLGAPQSLIADWTRALPGCDAIGLAVRDDLRSVRIYTQYWEAVVQKVRRGEDGPMMVYAGFKYLPDGSTRIDPYICLPGAPRAEFMPPITDALTRLGSGPGTIARAFAPLSPASCIFTRTGTKDGARTSWLATVRRANLDRAAVADMLAPLAADTQTAIIANAASDQDLLHIAGGEDRIKGKFTTLYFATNRDLLDDFFRE